MGDVTEFIIDGTSGLAPGGVEDRCIVAGCCSRGLIGKGYLLGKRSDLSDLLGVGPLVDALRDVFAVGGQEPVVIAVPVAGQPGGYITACRHEGPGPAGQSLGTPVRPGLRPWWTRSAVCCLQFVLICPSATPRSVRYPS